MSWPAVPAQVATKATPQASCSEPGRRARGSATAAKRRWAQLGARRASSASSPFPRADSAASVEGRSRGRHGPRPTTLPGRTRSGTRRQRSAHREMPAAFGDASHRPTPSGSSGCAGRVLGSAPAPAAGRPCRRCSRTGRRQGRRPGRPGPRPGDRLRPTAQRQPAGTDAERSQHRRPQVEPEPAGWCSAGSMRSDSIQHPAQGVGGDVERERRPWPSRNRRSAQISSAEHAEVPEHLVQEGRVEDAASTTGMPVVGRPPPAGAEVRPVDRRPQGRSVGPP